MSDMNIMMSTLKLVYPPVSNQEAEWVKVDAEVEREIRQSDFYVIGARAEATFDLLSIQQDGKIRISITTDNGLQDEAVLDPEVFANEALGTIPENTTFLMGTKVIQFYDGTDEEVTNGTANLFQWFTTEKLIYDRSRGIAGISEFDRFNEFATYELLYVGIAKTTDTFTRLFAGAHETRQKILSNEWPRRSNARVTDELYLFAFRIEPVIIRVLNENTQALEDSIDSFSKHRKTIVTDAEKAFVHMLDPEYNIEKFVSYPKSADGLYKHGYTSYGFVLGEDIHFTTSSAKLVGSYSAFPPIQYDHADVIVVSGETVRIHSAPEPPTVS